MRKLLAVVGFLTILGGVDTAYGDATPPRGSAGPGADATFAPLLSFGAVGSFVEGEGRALNAGCVTFPGDGVCGIQHLDWRVTFITDNPGLNDDVYEYRYQVENSSVTFLDIVTVDSLDFTSIAKSIEDLDDSPGHAIAGEHEGPVGSCCTAMTPGPFLLGITNATWLGIVNNEAGCFDVPGVLCETDTMIGFGPTPLYENWSTQNGSQWSTTTPACTAASCIRVPAPRAVPNPASLFLIGIGVALVGTVVRRRLRVNRS